MFNVVLGGVTVSIGLTFWWALIAIGAGTVIGALLIALHATQGPRLGVPGVTTALTMPQWILLLVIPSVVTGWRVRSCRAGGAGRPR